MIEFPLTNELNRRIEENSSPIIISKNYYASRNYYEISIKGDTTNKLWYFKSVDGGKSIYGDAIAGIYVATTDSTIYIIPVFKSEYESSNGVFVFLMTSSEFNASALIMQDIVGRIYYFTNESDARYAAKYILNGTDEVTIEELYNTEVAIGDYINSYTAKTEQSKSLLDLKVGDEIAPGTTLTFDQTKTVTSEQTELFIVYTFENGYDITIYSRSNTNDHSIAVSGTQVYLTSSGGWTDNPITFYDGSVITKIECRTGATAIPLEQANSYLTDWDLRFGTFDIQVPVLQLGAPTDKLIFAGINDRPKYNGLDLALLKDVNLSDYYTRDRVDALGVQHKMGDTIYRTDVDVPFVKNLSGNEQDLIDRDELQAHSDNDLTMIRAAVLQMKTQYDDLNKRFLELQASLDNKTLGTPIDIESYMGDGYTIDNAPGGIVSGKGLNVLLTTWAIMADGDPKDNGSILNLGEEPFSFEATNGQVITGIGITEVFFTPYVAV